FDTVAAKFISQFSHLTYQSPTLFDLISEKMKPDEDFLTYANRWRTMAVRSELPVPERQAITIIVNNATPQLKTVLMRSELRTFEQLYDRAKVVQAQIRESALPFFFEPKSRGRRQAPIPTTEGVTINEQVTAFQNPPPQQQCQYFQRAPQQQQQQPFQQP